jgi:hypothetical protein
MSTGNRLGAVPPGAQTFEQRHGEDGTAGPGARNDRYVSASAHLDADRTTQRFVPPASIDGWREKMRRDATMRAVLLNPVDYEPRDD